jgi:EmrB/QacA subfamily drug resistance transporter
MAPRRLPVRRPSTALVPLQQADPTRTGGLLRRGLGLTSHSTAYKWWVAATVMLSAFLVVASGATVNVALPSMMTAFGLNLDQVQWVMTAYMIAGAVLIPTIGWLGNRLGNRALFLSSLLVFVGSSVLCGLAWDGTSLIAFRVLQGLGGGPITPMAMVLLNDAFPERQRGLAMGLYGTAGAFGPAIGPVIGGYVTEYLNWRMVFYLNLAPGVMCMVLALLVLPNTREAVRRPLDLSGLVTMAVFLVSLLLALSQGQRLGWDSPFIQRLFVVAALSFVLFLGLQLLRTEPLVDLRLYKNLPFALASLIIFINSMNFWGTNFLQTILMQRLLDYTPAQVGYVIFPGAMALACTMVWAGRLTDKFDRRLLALGGLGAFALASYWFSFLTLEQPVSWVTWMIAARYLSVGFVFTPINTAALMLLPKDKVRMGSGLLNLVQQGIGGTTGLAIMTTLLQHRLEVYASLLDQQQSVLALGWGEALAPGRELLVSAGEVGPMVDSKALGLLQQVLLQQATVAAYQDCFLLVVALCLAVMPLVVCLRRRSTV